MFRKKYSKLFILSLIAVFFVTAGLGCRGISKELAQRAKPVNLVYWRTQDGQDAFGAIIQGFQALYPHVSITYRVIREQEYEQELLEAWAEDRGPDIFSIPNTWLGKYQSKILPRELGGEVIMAKQITTGSIKKETKLIKEVKKAPGLRQLRETFVEAVPKDVVIDNRIYGLPLSLDVLALYYNRDMLNSARIANAPQTWEEFALDVAALTLQDRYGEFIQSGAAFGASENISYVTDILSLLMFQNGTRMANERGDTATFHQSLPDDPKYFPAQEAMQFYVGFSQPGSDIYTWNNAMEPSLDAFIAGKVGFIFGYSDYLTKIKEQAPKLNFDISKVPQIAGSLKEVNYARYPIEVISKRTEHPHEAWAFVLYATETQNAKTFVERSKHPTAHRELIAMQLEDFDLNPFASGVLTAKTWYHGKNYSLVEEAFEEMVSAVLSGEKTVERAIDYGAKRVNLTY
ncbi:extracellular solute-binding protein [Patescibacteria group bacterium AH-259-L05]|nr:extracellular solute-binding protein [Patescibacteria group bacterium AH-259-L05]